LADFKEILKHGANYLVANLATKALAFISIPVYTHLLSTSDFGIVNIFLGVSGILSSLLTLCCDQAVSRYYFDRIDDEDFKKFVGTSSIIALIVFILNATILILLASQVGALTGLTRNVIYLLVPYTLVNVIGLTYEQIYTPMKKSKKIAISSLLRAYLGFMFAVAFIMFFKETKYLGQILGLICAGIIMIVIWSKGIAHQIILVFDRKYLRYILKFSVPLIPYALSGVIIEQFGKIAIGTTQNISQAGFYSLALTISGLVGIITAVTHQAWAPYYFEYMNAKNYAGHDTDIKRIFAITLIAGMGISTFGQEIGMILANKAFTSSLYLIPIFVHGFVLHQLAYVYMRNFSFVHRTYFSSIVVIAAGVINISLNLLIIPKYGEVGAAISFAFSYLSMAMLAWVANRFVIRCYCTPLLKLLRPLSIYILFSSTLFFLYIFNGFWQQFSVKVLLFSGFVVCIGWAERHFIRNFLKGA